MRSIPVFCFDWVIFVTGLVRFSAEQRSTEMWDTLHMPIIRTREVEDVKEEFHFPVCSNVHFSNWPNQALESFQLSKGSFLDTPNAPERNFRKWVYKFLHLLLFRGYYGSNDDGFQWNNLSFYKCNRAA